MSCKHDFSFYTCYRSPDHFIPHFWTETCTNVAKQSQSKNDEPKLKTMISEWEYGPEGMVFGKCSAEGKDEKIDMILKWVDEYRGAFSSRKRWLQEFTKMLKEVL